MAAFDMRAIETYETLAARAVDYGLIDVQVRARLDLSLLRRSRARSAAWKLRSARCSSVPSRIQPGAYAHVRAYAYRRLSVGGWNAQDALECRTGLAEIGENGGERDGPPDSVSRLVLGACRSLPD